MMVYSTELVGNNEQLQPIHSIILTSCKNISAALSVHHKIKNETFPKAISFFFPLETKTGGSKVKKYSNKVETYEAQTIKLSALTGK